MHRYMIELPHDDEHATCSRAVQSLEQYGAHFMTNAEWGCKDGVHFGWLILEVASRAEALQVVPPAFRPQVRIIELSRFTREDILSMQRERNRERLPLRVSA